MIPKRGGQALRLFHVSRYVSEGQYFLEIRKRIEADLQPC
jgi:hypothetical protein